MGKPRLIILLRHAQSTGNISRTIHQSTPDHLVTLTPLGHEQSVLAGTQLSTLLQPTDTLQIITSPYTRTRQTTLGLLSSPALIAHPNSASIRVHEEPRLREQDFGNFQPCAAETSRIWRERAAYGHFFYRIPNGESAADAYDRVSGFMESLWRQFDQEDFPSVLVLVTHGLMARVFLMRWFRYSVEYFEDLRNLGHCEMVVMERTDGPYELKTELRTWSGGKVAERVVYSCPPVGEGRVPEKGEPGRRGWEERKWGGCAGGCEHEGWEGKCVVDGEGEEAVPNGTGEPSEVAENGVKEEACARAKEVEMGS